MSRILRRAILALLILAAATFVGDYGVWRMRGGPLGSVEVTRFVVATLKGNKEEYYPDGVESVDCSRSLLPEAGAGACWWVERHSVVMDRVTP